MKNKKFETTLLRELYDLKSSCGVKPLINMWKTLGKKIYDIDRYVVIDCELLEKLLRYIHANFYCKEKKTTDTIHKLLLTCEYLCNKTYDKDHIRGNKSGDAFMKTYLKEEGN